MSIKMTLGRNRASERAKETAQGLHGSGPEKWLGVYWDIWRLTIFFGISMNCAH
jgi:hypothetical protein